MTIFQTMVYAQHLHNVATYLNITQTYTMWLLMYIAVQIHALTLAQTNTRIHNKHTKIMNLLSGNV